MEWMMLAAIMSLITVMLASKHKGKLGLSFVKSALALLAVVGFAQDLRGHQGEGKGLGLRPVPPEVMEHVQNHWPRIVGVRPNKVGLERIHEHRRKSGLPEIILTPASHAEEFIVVTGRESSDEHLHAVDSSSLPRSVNNSQLPSFPPVGDQQQLGSCVAWGSTYYQGTHEYGLLNGLNNKASFQNVFSPKWTYNMMNGGQDGGLDIFSTFELFAQNGAVSIASFPYDTDYQAWDLNASDWVAAINHRTSAAQLISGLGGDQQNLDVIKQVLNNGHIVNIGTFVESWVMDTVKADPAAASNPHAGEQVASWMNGSNGGHCMTIVGYDDDIWVDINKNGKVDPGEKGAFLIANSWGPDWGNKGFVWAAYDAFLTHSAVPNGPSAGRVPLGDAMNSQVVNAVPIAHNYSPKVIAQFSLSSAERDLINVSIGISDTNSTTPTKTINSCALYNKGGAYEFDGTSPSSPETATFAVDMTDLIPAVQSPTQRYYLIVANTGSGQPTTVNSLTLIDAVHNTKTKCTTLPGTCDNNQVVAYVDYSYSDGPTPPPAPPAPVPPAPPAPVPPAPVPPVPPPAPPVPPVPPAPPSPPTVRITSPFNNQFVMGTVWVTASAKDKQGIDRVEFYVDGILCSTDKTAPYQILLSTDNLYPGVHTLTAIAYNTAGQSSTSSVNVYVFNYW